MTTIFLEDGSNDKTAAGYKEGYTSSAADHEDKKRKEESTKNEDKDGDKKEDSDEEGDGK